jgi:hypothetical protein
MQYTASSFAASILVAYGLVTGVVKERSPEKLATHAVDPVLRGSVLPAWRSIASMAERLRTLQRGTLFQSFLYLGAAVVTLLFYLLLRLIP